MGRMQAILTGIGVTLLLLLSAVNFPAVIERVNNAVTAIQIRLLPYATLSSLPVIVEVDEKSLATYGQWPWPRYQVARLLAGIQQSGAAAVGIDALFLENDRTSPLEIQRTLEKDLHQKLPLTTVKESFWDYDSILGQTLNAGPFVASYLFTFDNTETNPCLPKAASGALFSDNSEKNASQPLYNATNIACNVASIQQGANGSGFINSAPDNDGIYRKTPLVIRFKGRYYPSLALQTYLTANALGHFLISTKSTGLSLELGKISVPLDEAGNLLLKFPAHGKRFERISAVEFLSGNISPSRMKGRIVFVGFSAAGLHEVRPTPYNPEFLGVELHATVIDNIGRQDFLQRPDNAQAFELIIAALIGLALFILLANAEPIAIIAIPTLLIALLLTLSQLLLAYTGIVISPALPVIMASLSLMVQALVKYSREFLHAKRMTLQVSRTQEGIIGSICSMSEYRDPDTGAHIKRTQEYIRALAKHLQNHPKFKEELTDDMVELLFKAAPLHDIGKIGIRDNVLLKPGRLDPEEFEVMKAHPQIGAKVIESVATQIGWNPFMKVAYQICLYHQEKWDGSGYPEGLKGEQIPLPARLMALADVYDALINKRIYKPAFPHAMAVGLIREGKNSHFDPLLVEGFESIHEQFQDIARLFIDNADGT